MQQYQVSNDTDYTTVFMRSTRVADDYFLYVQNTEFLLYRSTHPHTRCRRYAVTNTSKTAKIIKR